MNNIGLPSKVYYNQMVLDFKERTGRNRLDIKETIDIVWSIFAGEVFQPQQILGL